MSSSEEPLSGTEGLVSSVQTSAVGLPESGVASPFLLRLGWSPCFAEPFERYAREGYEPARVVVEHNHLYRLATARGELLAEVAGRLRHAATGPEELPAVGDWVAARQIEPRKAIVHVVLPRRSCFARKAAGDPTRCQVVAANVDTVFLVSGLDGEFNPRRIERYLAAAAESGARPVVVLNKADLCGDPGVPAQMARVVAPGVPVHVTSSLTGIGLEVLLQYAREGATVALLGSSGTGKSTIINRLLGAERQRTRAVRERDSRGRHTTMHRELVPLASGGVLIDTPGMRELQLWDAPLEVAFADIERLGADCHFRDCRHETEPRCAVRQAVSDGHLPAARLENYRRLQAERAYLNRRQDEWAALAEKRRVRSIHRIARKHTRKG